VKSNQISTSTTDTLSKRKPAGSQAVLTMGVVALAVPTHAFLHVSLLTGTVVAVALLRPDIRVPDLLGALFGVLIAVGGVIFVLLKGEDPSDYFTRALANITNATGSRALIPAESKTRCSQPEPEPTPAPEPARAPEPALSPLPPATNAARNEEEHMFWQLVHDRMPASVSPRARGRHAKVATADMAATPTDDLTERESQLVIAITADDLKENQLIIAEPS
jgi:hypothetical protein